MKAWGDDFWQACRACLAWRGGAALIVLTLGFGIGVSAAMASLVYQVLLAPLPIAESGRWLQLQQHHRRSGVLDSPWMVTTFHDLRKQTEVFEALLPYVQLEYTLHDDGQAYFATVGIVEGEHFSTLGVPPTLGRVLRATDDRAGAAPVMLLGQAFWRERFGADPEVLGRTLEMNGIAYTVIGVLPELPPYPRRNDVWIPMATDRVMSDERILTNRTDSTAGILWSVLGRLRAGASQADADRDLETIAQRLRETWPEVYPSGYAIETVPLREAMVAGTGPMLVLLLGLAFLVALIACANVANLQLARLLARQQDLAVREALGAAPGRLRRLLWTENGLLALGGGLLGLALAFPLLGLLEAFAGGFTPLANAVDMRSGVLVGAPLLGLLSGLVCGALQPLGRRELMPVLKEGGRNGASALAARRRQGLLAAQVGLSFLLLSAAALMLLSIGRLMEQDLGYDTRRVMTASLQLNENYPSLAHAIGFTDDVLRALRALPGVEVAAFAGSPLLREPLYGLRPVQVEGRNSSEEGGKVFSAFVTEDYFHTLRIPLLKGRFLTPADDADGPPVLLVNENFERHHFPGGDVLGQRVSFNEGESWRTIVGVVGDIRSLGIDRPDGETVYSPFRQTPSSLLNLFVKYSGSAANIEAGIRRALRERDPGLPLESILPLDALKGEWLAPRVRLAALTILFGGLALLVALTGTIAVIQWNIAQRRREIGIRMALGASPARVAGGLLLDGARVCLIGAGVGLALTLAVSPWLEPLLFATSATEPAVYAAALGLLALGILPGLYLPARKAARGQSMAVLRGEDE